MKKTCTVLTILIFSFISPSCNVNPDLTKPEIYKILNEIIADNKLSLDVVCTSLYNIPLSGPWSSDFSSTDKSFILHQAALFKGFRLEPNQLKYFSSRQKKIKMIYIDTNCKVGFVSKLSFPIISPDRKKVVLRVDELCNCILGGGGGTYLYVKLNGRWHLEKTYDSWVSSNITKSRHFSNYL